MTGPLILAADPQTALGAVTKQYSDAHTTFNAANYVNKAGDTMTGPLTVGGNGVAYTMGGWNNHTIAFGWDGTLIDGGVDGTYIGQLATVSWVQSWTGGQYLPMPAGGTITNLTVTGGAWLNYLGQNLNANGWQITNAGYLQSNNDIRANGSLYANGNMQATNAYIGNAYIGYLGQAVNANNQQITGANYLQSNGDIRANGNLFANSTVQVAGQMILSYDGRYTNLAWRSGDQTRSRYDNTLGQWEWVRSDGTRVMYIDYSGNLHPGGTLYVALGALPAPETDVLAKLRALSGTETDVSATLGLLIEAVQRLAIVAAPAYA